ncbi:hypothetical protein [Shewanella sp. MEBiC00475]|uniref:hypothetical protein n=1 Tax=Shewanella sp. MEBiC00475 TaxID=2575361 RepID=UPI0010C1212A|nr:hypothetical protein [Shewanella sp. MEBiC00475]
MAKLQHINHKKTDASDLSYCDEIQWDISFLYKVSLMQKPHKTNRFAINISTVFASAATGLILNKFEMDYHLFIGSFDVVRILVNAVVFVVLLYPFSRFSVGCIQSLRTEFGKPQVETINVNGNTFMFRPIYG